MKKDIPVEELTALLGKQKGNVSVIARKFGVSRGTILNRINESPDLQKALQDARESMLDNAESVLYKKVLEGSTPELLFFLKTQGKSRGYIERNEVSGPNGGPIETRNVIELSDEELARIATSGSGGTIKA